MTNALASAALLADETGDCEIATMLRRHARAVEACGQVAFCSICEITGQPHLTVPRCKHRQCPSCQVARGNALRNRTAAVVRTFKERRFITLTMKHSNDQLAVQMKRLTRCFAKLRRSKKVARLFKGGVYTIEMTRNHQTHQWHPHLHTIADGDYVDSANLAREWHRITGDSHIVDIRYVYDPKKAVGEICKYIGKSTHPNNLTGSAYLEYTVCLHSARLIETYGTARNFKPTDELLPEPRSIRRIVSLAAILAHAKRGDPAAASLARRWSDFHRVGMTENANTLGHDTKAWYDATILGLAASKNIIDETADSLLYDAIPPPPPRATCYD